MEEESAKLLLLSHHFKVRTYTTDAYFTLLPHRRPNGNVYTQIARVSVPKSLGLGGETFLSMGDYDVDKIDALDVKNGRMWELSHNSSYVVEVYLLSVVQLLHSTCSPFQSAASLFHLHFTIAGGYSTRYCSNGEEFRILGCRCSQMRHLSKLCRGQQLHIS